MKVLFINDIGFQYGAGIAQRRQVQSFLLMGHEVKALCWQVESQNEKVFSPIMPPGAMGTWVGLKQLKHLHKDNGYTEIQIITQIVQEAKDFAPNIIIVGNLHAAKWPLTVLPALQGVAPVIAYAHDCHLFTGRCTYPSDCALYLSRCDATCPTADEYPALPPPQIPGAWQLRRDIFTGVDGIPLAANSQWTLKTMQSAMPTLSYAGLAYLGFDTHLFRPVNRRLARQILGLPEDAFIVLAGSTNIKDKRKGGNLLPQITQALNKEALFVVFGFNSQQVDNAFTTGLVREFEKMPLLYSAANVHLSIANAEAFGQTLGEAAACGIPSVAFNVGGIPEIARHGVNARLAETQDIDGIIEAIRFFRNNPEVSISYGKAGQEIVANEFSLSSQAKGWQTFLVNMQKHYQPVVKDQKAARLITQQAQAAYPKISIVTPSFNQAQFLESTIKSVLSQNYPNLEYIIIDGGSTDGSTEIIARYETQLHYWVSEKDRGHAHAINKGMQHSSGEIMGWINSDDILMPGSLFLMAELFTLYPEMEWLTAPPTLMDPKGRIIKTDLITRWSRRKFLRMRNIFIQQESTVWRRSLWEKAGGYVSEEYLACDFELWARFFRHVRLYHTQGSIGAFRYQPNQRSLTQRKRYEEEMQVVIDRELKSQNQFMISDREAESYSEIYYNPLSWRFEKFDTSDLISASESKLVHTNLNLKDKVIIKELLTPPWGIEVVDATKLPFPQHRRNYEDNISFIWMGQGEENGLIIILESKNKQTINLHFKVNPGPSREDRLRTLNIVLYIPNNPSQSTLLDFDSETKLTYITTLEPGSNKITIGIKQSATIGKLPNGDPRPLLAALCDLHISAQD